MTGLTEDAMSHCCLITGITDKKAEISGMHIISVIFNFWIT